MPTRLLLAFAAVHALHVPRRPAPAPAAVGRRAALAAATLILPKRATAEEAKEAKNEVVPGTDEFLAAAGLKKKTVLNADGTMNTPEELRAVFEAAGVDLGKPAITTCGSGVTAAILSLAMERFGKSDHSLYDGSWAEWGAFPTMPVATGEA